MFLFLFVFWPLLGGYRFAAANLGPPVAESTLYFSRSGKSFAASKSMECESQQQGKQKGARPSPENRLCCGWQDVGIGGAIPFPYLDKVACALLYIYYSDRLTANPCFFTIGGRPIAANPAAIGGLPLSGLPSH